MLSLGRIVHVWLSERGAWFAGVVSAIEDRRVLVHVLVPSPDRPVLVVSVVPEAEGTAWRWPPRV